MTSHTRRSPHWAVLPALVIVIGLHLVGVIEPDAPTTARLVLGAILLAFGIVWFLYWMLRP